MRFSLIFLLLTSCAAKAPYDDCDPSVIKIDRVLRDDGTCWEAELCCGGGNSEPYQVENWKCRGI